MQHINIEIYHLKVIIFFTRKERFIIDGISHNLHAVDGRTPLENCSVLSEIELAIQYLRPHLRCYAGSTTCINRNIIQSDNSLQIAY